MNAKRVNRLFLVMALMHLAVAFLPYPAMERLTGSAGTAVRFFAGELLIVLPAVLFFVAAGEKRKKLLPFRRLKFTSLLMIIVFTYLMMPLTTVINIISMLFVDNVVASAGTEILKMPFWLAFLLMAVYAPVVEELVFRGIVYGGYKQSGTVWKSALLSALIFGALHMNFNQAPYAIVLGLVFALLVEATGSLWAGILFHVIFNGNTVCLLFLAQKFFPEMALEQAGVLAGNTQWAYALCFYMAAATAATAAAACVFVWIAGNEGRLEHIKALRREKRDPAETMATPAFIAAAVLCLAYMILTAVLRGILW